MKYSNLLVAFLAVGLIGCSTTKMPKSENIVDRFGLYIVSENLSKSEIFYTALFETDPQVTTPVFIGYDVSGGLFAVVSRDTFAPNSVQGDNAVPYMKTNDIQAAFNHVKNVAPNALQSDAVLNEGSIMLFKFTDPDGNLLEYFSTSNP